MHYSASTFIIISGTLLALIVCCGLYKCRKMHIFWYYLEDKFGLYLVQDISTKKSTIFNANFHFFVAKKGVNFTHFFLRLLNWMLDMFGFAVLIIIYDIVFKSFFTRSYFLNHSITIRLNFSILAKKKHSIRLKPVVF